jgi:anionic cell wall polymer biosynthesis LytR-Cps2A-Psr (LCP) family protein
MPIFWATPMSYRAAGQPYSNKPIALNFGIPVDYYVRVNFTAFETLINEIGGISVTVPRTHRRLKIPRRSIRL